MCDRSTARFFTLLFFVILALFDFCLGVSEAVFLSEYSSYSEGCSQIWKWILAACIFNIVVSVLTCCGAGKFISEETENPFIKCWIYFWYFVGLGLFVVAIWSAITYYNINASCYDFWNSNAPHLYMFVLIHFVKLWISVGMCAIAIVYGCIIGCGNAFENL